MIKKVGVLFVMPVLIILIILFSIGFISAASCSIVARGSCTDNIVMGVSDLTNAHGEFPDVGTYDYVLCCDFSGPIGTTCTGTNKIIGLSSATNAHAEIPSETTYTTEVCYEDLACMSLDTTGSNCDVETSGSYPIDILSLSDYTNAHIGNITDYPSVSICCVSPSAPGICSLTNAYWSIDGTNPIVSGNNTVLNQQNVYLIVEGTNCAGETISFEVTEGGFISQGSASVQPVNVTFGSDGVWSAEFMSTLLDSAPEFYFTATVVGSDPVESVTSNTPDLEVTEQTVDDYCLSVSLCADYYDAGSVLASDSCNNNICPGIPSESEPGYDPNADSNYCAWDTGTSSCLLVNAYGGEGVCGDGTVDRPNSASSNEQCDPDTGTNFWYSTNEDSCEDLTTYLSMDSYDEIGRAHV